MNLMKIGFALAACLSLVLPAQARTDVGVSVQISQPGVYGRIDIGQYPQPALVVRQPIWVERPVQVMPPPPPVYMWVPTGHQKNWRKHCARYGACGAPVYFVQDRWYQQQVMQHGHPGRGRGDDGAHGRGRGDDGDRGRGHDKGRGKGHRD